MNELEPSEDKSKVELFGGVCYNDTIKQFHSEIGWWKNHFGINYKPMDYKDQSGHFIVCRSKSQCNSRYSFDFELYHEEGLLVKSVLCDFGILDTSKWFDWKAIELPIDVCFNLFLTNFEKYEGDDLFSFYQNTMPYIVRRKKSVVQDYIGSEEEKLDQRALDYLKDCDEIYLSSSADILCIITKSDSMAGFVKALKFCKWEDWQSNYFNYALDNSALFEWWKKAKSNKKVEIAN